jgi:hypothetical protein
MFCCTAGIYKQESRLNTDHKAASRAVDSNAANTRLTGSWLIIARVAWLALVVTSVGLFFVSLPPYLTNLQTVCVHQPCPYYQLTLNNVRALHELGISVDSYIAFTATFNVFIALVLFVAGSVLAWRKPDDWMALLVSFMLVVSAAGTCIGDGFINNQAGYGLPALLLNSLGGLITFLVFLLFPSGRFVPRWGWCFFLLFVITSIPHQYFANWPYSLAGWAIALNILAFVGSILSVPLTQIYRYRHVSTPVQRQQTKWIVVGISLFFLVLLGSLIIFLAFSGSLFYLAYSVYVINAAFLLIPLSFAIAILRYRLYDIDLLINRTLVYGTLTVLLALVYFGLIIALQYLLRGIISQNNDVAIVVSTLAIAALFQPLRHRIQTVIDRRFYRRKYDAAKIVEAFSATLRNEVDLSQLREHLLGVVQETMQPMHVSLWLRQSTGKASPSLQTRTAPLEKAKVLE